MESPLGSLANEMKKKVKETVKSEFLLRLLLPTIISWRFFSVLVFGFGFGCDVRFLFAFCLLFTYDR